MSKKEDGTQPITCDLCGCIIGDQSLHDNFHDEFSDLIYGGEDTE